MGALIAIAAPLTAFLLIAAAGDAYKMLRLGLTSVEREAELTDCNCHVTQLVSPEGVPYGYLAQFNIKTDVFSFHPNSELLDWENQFGSSETSPTDSTDKCTGGPRSRTLRDDWCSLTGQKVDFYVKLRSQEMVPKTGSVWKSIDSYYTRQGIGFGWKVSILLTIATLAAILISGITHSAIQLFKHVDLIAKSAKDREANLLPRIAKTGQMIVLPILSIAFIIFVGSILIATLDQFDTPSDIGSGIVLLTGVTLIAFGPAILFYIVRVLKTTEHDAYTLFKAGVQIASAIFLVFGLLSFAFSPGKTFNNALEFSTSIFAFLLR